MRTAIVAVLLLLLSAAAAHAQECVTSTNPALSDFEQTLTRWQKYDENAVLDVHGDIAHAASARANFSAVATDWHLMLHPDGAQLVQSVLAVPVLGPALVVAVLPASWIADGLEVVGGPFSMVKDASDGAVHGALSVFHRDGALPPKRQ